jgi:hypothetical protein
LTVQGGIALVFHACIHCTLIRLTTSIGNSFFIALLSSYSTGFSGFGFSILKQRCYVFPKVP